VSPQDDIIMNNKLSKKPIISIIAAIGKNRELGKDNKLLWHIKKDLQHFKKITFGHPVIMGRKTFESIGKPLPDRINIVVTRQNPQGVKAIPPLRWKSVIICPSLNEAINYAKTNNQKEIFIIGGASIYQQAISLADKLYLTLVNNNFDADVFFPDYSMFKQLVSDSGWQKETKHQFKFLELIK